MQDDVHPINSEMTISNNSSHHVKIPAAECSFLITSCGLPDAEGVRTRTAVYYPGGSPQLQFPYKSPQPSSKTPPPPSPHDYLLSPEVQIGASEDSR